MDESSGTSDTAQLSIFFCGMDSSLCITEELLELKSMPGTTTEKNSLRRYPNVQLKWSCFAIKLWDWHPSSVPQLYCKAAAMCSQPCRLAYSLSLHHTPQIIVLQSSENSYKHQVVNMIGAKVLDHCQFMSCLEIGSEYRDAPYHREVRCLSGGKVLSRCFELCDVSVSGK